jgi:hypothetical protein
VDEHWNLLQRYEERVVVADSSGLVKEHQSIEYFIQEIIEIFIKPDNVKERTHKTQ